MTLFKDDGTGTIDATKVMVKALQEKVKRLRKKAKKETIMSHIQMIFQDPIASLNPRMTVRNIIAEGLIIKGVKDKEFIDKEVKRVLELVGLLPEHANRYPHEFSGGQRQRIGIARAIIMNPELIIADEPVSALDVSSQAQVINLLNDLRNNLGLTILFIAHNLSVVKYFCDRIAVMYYGQIMELTTSEELFKHPCHPYTISLLSAVPQPDPNIEKGRDMVQNVEKQMKELEKNEIKRLCREFTVNNYGEVYKVCPYIVVSAICGDEGKEEGMMLFNMTEKEIIENKKLIRFFSIKK